MAELPIMPLNVAMLTADTRHMTPLQFGAYCRILFHMWLQRGRLPDDREQLRIIVGVSPKQWRRIERVVMRPFTIAEGEVSQKRLTDVMLKTRELRAKNAARATHAANSRYGKPRLQLVPRGDHSSDASD